MSDWTPPPGDKPVAATDSAWTPPPGDKPMVSADASPKTTGIPLVEAGERFMQHQRENASGAVKEMAEGAQEGFKPHPGDFTGASYFGPAIKMVGGAASYLMSPIDSAAQTLVGDPVTTATGSKTAGDIASVGTEMLGPGGVRKIGEMGLSVGERALKEGGEVAAAGMKQASDLTAKATEKIMKRFSQDTAGGGLSAEDAMEKISKARDAGKPMTLADVGSENVKGLAGNLARQPGEARTQIKGFLESRDMQSGPRLTGDIDKYVATGSMKDTVDGLLKARSSAARPLYEQMEKLDGVWSPQLQRFLDDPALKSGLAKGFELERLDALAEGRPFDPHTMGVDLDAQGNIKLVKAPNMRVLDMGKRGLDAMIADERDPLTGRLSARGFSLEQVRRAYLNKIESLDKSGVYKAAREAWAGPSASMDAVRFGRTIFNQRPEEIAEHFEGLSDSDKEFMKLGVADMLKERIGKTGLSGDEAKSIIKNQWTKDQLRPLFKSDAEFNKFVDAVSAEQQMYGTGKTVLGGSNAARETEDAMANIETGIHAAKGVGHAILGNPLATIQSYLRVKRDLGMRQNSALNTEMAKILFDPNLQLDQKTGQFMKGVPQETNPAQQ